MSAFAIFALFLTVLYVIYYSVIIMQDLYGKKDAPKSTEEEIDVSQMQETEEPMSVTESADGFRLGGEQEEDAGVTFINNEDDAERYQEKVQEERRTSAADFCSQVESALDPVDVDSTGGVEDNLLRGMLIKQKPGGPKIFQIREIA